MKSRIPRWLRRLVWLHYIGDEILGACFCCGRELERIQDWHCGHVVAEARGGGLSIENLRPVCKHCNWSMQTNNMLEWMWRQGFPVPMEICT